MISVLILTLNEEKNIAECIESIPWRSDVVVLDSKSTDKTSDIATSLGARVVERRFTNYADQRNFGLSLEFSSNWILMLDADERLSPDLARQIETEISLSSSPADLYRFRRKDYFLGRWIKRASGYPTWFPRLFKKGSVQVSRDINEEYSTDGPVKDLPGHIIHFPFSKGVDWWFERHNSYSRREAVIASSLSTVRFKDIRALFNRDSSRRRSTAKRILYALPMRPIIVFLYLYIYRGGFLEGRAGFLFCAMRASYEVMIDTKVAEIRFRG